MKYNSWNIISYSPEKSTAKGLSSLVSAVLNSRDTNIDDTTSYFDNSLENLYPCTHLKDIQAGSLRVNRAIEQGEHTAVFGDYDVDGITSACLLSSYLISRGLEPEVYIPERLDEGYGLSKEALDFLHSLGVTLIITVDCGIAAIDEANYAAKLGIDLVITDHHEAQSKIPKAVAVIDPKRKDDTYPFKDLAGVGVAYKFICAIEGTGQEERLFDEYGDLIALGTVADMMPLTGENHIMVRRGLSLINKLPRPGIAALLKEAGIKDGELTAQGISFGLSPRLNAAGRMGSAKLALELLSENDPSQAKFRASQLGSLNKLRQKTESRILDEALTMLADSGYKTGPIILYSDNWHKGVVGIVAAKLMRIYLEPVVLITIEDSTGKGSCRSVSGFNIFEALSQCNAITNYGGHELAAGVTVEVDKIQEFMVELIEYYEKNPPNDEINRLNIDFSLRDPSLLNLDNVKSLDMLEPFGTGNPAPILCIENTFLDKIVPLSGGKHLRLTIKKWGLSFDCVFFSVTSDELSFTEGEFIDIAFTPQINTFRGNSNVQLLVSDIRETQNSNVLSSLEIADIVKYSKEPSEIWSICPERSDFAHLYKHLTTIKLLSGSKLQVLNELETEIGKGSAERYYICLGVMNELGLLELKEDKLNISVSLNPNPSKVDLESSTLLRSLRHRAGLIYS